MIGLDTNVVVRYLTRDDEDQTRLADSVVDSLTTQSPGFISLVVAVETWWVLSTRYRFPRERCVAAITALVGSSELAVEREDIVTRGLAMAAAGADFADAVITLTGRAAGCAETVTFDRGAGRSAGMRLLA